MKPRTKIRRSRWYSRRNSNLAPSDTSQKRDPLSQLARQWV